MKSTPCVAIEKLKNASNLGGDCMFQPLSDSLLHKAHVLKDKKVERV